uniref:Peptidase_M16 domain-containing protein n=1 Tax=Toxocara canis TaxID=6265 RepID=A0A183V0H2_TOXCA
LSAALANGSVTKFSSRIGHGAVAEAVYKASSGRMAAVSPINEIHSDAGLVGVYVAADGDNIAPLVAAAVDAMKSFRVDDTAVNISNLIVLPAFNAGSSICSTVDPPQEFRRIQILILIKAAIGISRLCAEVDALTACESSSVVAVDRAAQLLASGRTLSAGDFIQLVRNVTADDVNKAAQRLTRRLSIASHGNVAQVPYLDEL